MKFTDLPKSIKILDTTYKIEYVNSPIDVDVHKRQALWGQIDYWTRTIRIYKNNRTPEDLWQTLWHEVFHGICAAFGMYDLNADEDKINKLSTGINTIVIDNFIKKN